MPESTRMPQRFGPALAIAAIGVAAALARGPADAQQVELLRIPLVIHVGVRDGAPLVDHAAVSATVARANGYYAAAAVCFSVREIRDGATPATLETIRDRRALRSQVLPNAINAFLVESIRDERPSQSTRRTAARLGFAPTGWLNGAHVPAPGRRPATYLIVRIATASVTLAHELGHFFGEPHTRDAANLMAYGNTREAFNETQLTRIRRRVQGALRRRTLRAAASCEGG